MGEKKQYKTVAPDELKIIPGDLATCIAYSAPYSRQTASEIMYHKACLRDRAVAKELASSYVYTANVSLFRKQFGQAQFGMGFRLAFDLVYGEYAKNGMAIANPAIDELVRKKFYRITHNTLNDKLARLAAMESTGEVVFVNAEQVNLIGDEEADFGFIRIHTNAEESHPNAASANAGMLFVRAGYGEGAAQKQVLDYLSCPDANIKETAVFLPSVRFIEQALAGINDGEMIAMACMLGNINDASIFFANSHLVNSCHAMFALPARPARKKRQASSQSLEALAG